MHPSVVAAREPSGNHILIHVFVDPRYGTTGCLRWLNLASFEIDLHLTFSVESAVVAIPLRELEVQNDRRSLHQWSAQGYADPLPSI